MDERIKGMWIDALLSGEYNKIEGQLKTNLGHCAEGVLCELAVQQGVDVEVTQFSERSWAFDHEFSIFPRSVQVWAGIKPGDPEQDVWGVNDSDAATFDDVVRLLKDLP